MPFSIKTQTTVTSGGGTLASLGNTYTCDQENILDETIPVGATTQEIDFTFPISGLQIISIVPSVDLTVKTNSSGSPQETLNLKAGVGVHWTKDDDRAVPFAGAVTKIFITNATGKAGSLKGVAGFGDQV